MTQIVAKPRFVALFDILAFKRLREIRSTNGLYSYFSRSVVASIQHAAMPVPQKVERNGQTILIPDPASKRCGFYYFSDTIVYFTDDDSIGSFLNIVLTSRELLNSGFGTHAPMRGAIGHGDFIDDAANRIFLGSALEDAHSYCESQVWSGCILTPDAAAFCQQSEYFDTLKQFFEQRDDDPRTRRNADLLVEYECPLQTLNRDRPREYFKERVTCINWTLNVFEDAARKSFPESRESHPLKIRENTEAFELWARQRKQI